MLNEEQKAAQVMEEAVTDLLTRDVIELVELGRFKEAEIVMVKVGGVDEEEAKEVIEECKRDYEQQKKELK